MKFRVAHVFYAMTLIAAAINLLGGFGLIPAVLVLATWYFCFGSVARKRWAVLMCGFVATATVVIALSSSIEVSRSQSRQLQCASNQRNILLALWSYEARYGSFPPAITRDLVGKPMHSWRVLILPFLGEDELYSRYRMDEPWNSANNSKLLMEMPSVYRCPESLPGMASPVKFATSYCVVVDERSFFPPDRGRKRSEFTDGLASTLAIFEYDTGKIPWMAPEDLTLEQCMQHLTQWSGSNRPPHVHTRLLVHEYAGANIGLADTNVAIFGMRERPKLLRQLILIDDSVSNVPAIQYLDRRTTSVDRIEGYTAVVAFLLFALLPVLWVRRS